VYYGTVVVIFALKLGMQTEVVRIIESALNGQSTKVREYCELLIQNLKKEGDEKFAERLERTLKMNVRGSQPMASLDEIANFAPKDAESKLSMLEVENPKVVKKLILADNIEESISDFIKRVKARDQLRSLGIDPKLSILLYGPPGCGKTTIANYIAKETELPIVTARLDTIVSSLLGSTSKNIRKVFEYTNNKPCILFLDEFDAIAKARDNEFEHGELKRVINSLLQSIDQYNNVLIAATNHSEILDNAVWRRFSTIIEVTKPTSKEFIMELMESVLREHNITLESEKNKEAVIENFVDLSPSDIRSILLTAISNMIINGEKKLSYITLLSEIFKAKRHGKVDKLELIEFLNQNNISQLSISEWTGLSLRKIKETLSKK
jgi:SpoVK/Ycf46/Vps4 family AAA+-type ATPase